MGPSSCGTFWTTSTKKISPIVFYNCRCILWCLRLFGFPRSCTWCNSWWSVKFLKKFLCSMSCYCRLYTLLPSQPWTKYEKKNKNKRNLEVPVPAICWVMKYWISLPLRHSISVYVFHWYLDFLNDLRTELQWEPIIEWFDL